MGKEQTSGQSPHASNIRAVWGTAELRGLWEKARAALESPNPPATFRLELPDSETQRAVGELYGRPMWGQGTRINVSTLDSALRGKRFGLGLAEVLEILHDTPVTRRESSAETRDQRREQVVGTFHDALAAEGLDRQQWAEPWAQWVYQYGRVADEEREVLARRAAAVLARLTLDPQRGPDGWAARTDFANRFGGGSHELDSGMPLSRLVLRAAALAHETSFPSNERERRALWERCGVALDAVSATVLCWALPVTGEAAWAESIRQRTAAGLPAHLSHLDLRCAPAPLVEPGTTIAICENPRVLEAVVMEDIAHPLVCVSGHPATVASELLHRLSASDAKLVYHGDFDWAGIAIARSIRDNHGASLWRMGADDYREALNNAAAHRVDLPSLLGEAAETPWDPALSELMATAGRAVEEETVLQLLLDDLRHEKWQG